jgi:hypothetical protein
MLLLGTSWGTVCITGDMLRTSLGTMMRDAYLLIFIAKNIVFRFIIEYSSLRDFGLA